jgi:uncharacterized SAM-binding protein YcdF (DUF218 family)
LSSKEIFKNYFWFFLSLIVVTFVVLELVGMQQYGVDICNIQKNQNIPQKPEMIVVLAGSVGRIETAYELMKGHDIPLLLIAGAHTKVNFDELSRKYRWDTSDRERIMVDNVSTTTWENAKVSEEFARQHNIKNIVLVTSIYHMQRAEFLFKKIFNHDHVQIIPYGTYVQPIELNSWWRDLGVFQKVFKEYFKFQYYRMIFAGR